MEQDLKNKGLISKYIIQKANGKPLDTRAKYFVLRYDNFGSDPIHLKACQKALKTYANEIKDHLPLLAKDLFSLLKQ